MNTDDINNILNNVQDLRVQLRVAAIRATSEETEKIKLAMYKLQEISNIVETM